MMEKLGMPQTHLALKEMIKQVDEDKDGKISFREVNMNFEKRNNYFLFNFMYSFYLYFEKLQQNIRRLKMINHRLHLLYNNYIQCLWKSMYQKKALVERKIFLKPK